MTPAKKEACISSEATSERADELEAIAGEASAASDRTEELRRGEREEEPIAISARELQRRARSCDPLRRRTPTPLPKTLNSRETSCPRTENSHTPPPWRAAATSRCASTRTATTRAARAQLALCVLRRRRGDGRRRRHRRTTGRRHGHAAVARRRRRPRGVAAARVVQLLDRRVGRPRRARLRPVVAVHRQRHHLAGRHRRRARARPPRVALDASQRLRLARRPPRHLHALLLARDHPIVARRRRRRRRRRAAAATAVARRRLVVGRHRAQAALRPPRHDGHLRLLAHLRRRRRAATGQRRAAAVVFANAVLRPLRLGRQREQCPPRAERGAAARSEEGPTSYALQMLSPNASLIISGPPEASEEPTPSPVVRRNSVGQEIRMRPKSPT